MGEPGPLDVLPMRRVAPALAAGVEADEGPS
jgi:hypothetical protein